MTQVASTGEERYSLGSFSSRITRKKPQKASQWGKLLKRKA
jgi:hypothetical protein